MKKIVIILPYYGKLPAFIYMWLKSCESNSTIDWLLISDDENLHIKKSLPKNVTYINLKFDLLKAKVDNVIGFDFKGFNPYRLCDCRPFYGEIFEEYITNYDFWGWCDPDMIFGDLRKYLKENKLNKYDRIYPKGHLSLMKNNERVKKFITNIKNDPRVIKIFKSTRPKGFDEGLFNELCEDISFYKEMHHVDINPKAYILRDLRTGERCFINYDNGVLYENKTKKEISYVHYQKRSFNINKINSDTFNINEEGFVNIDTDTDTEMMEESIETRLKDLKYKFSFVKKYLIPIYSDILKERLVQKGDR
ncbi:TPA: DUF6625 family protein [Photobacterium damselae]